MLCDKFCNHQYLSAIQVPDSDVINNCLVAVHKARRPPHGANRTETHRLRVKGVGH
jgi:hypothetical protein